MDRKQIPPTAVLQNSAENSSDSHDNNLNDRIDSVLKEIQIKSPSSCVAEYFDEHDAEDGVESESSDIFSEVEVIYSAEDDDKCDDLLRCHQRSQSETYLAGAKGSFYLDRIRRFLSNTDGIFQAKREVVPIKRRVSIMEPRQIDDADFEYSDSMSTSAIPLCPFSTPTNTTPTISVPHTDDWCLSDDNDNVTHNLFAGSPVSVLSESDTISAQSTSEKHQYSFIGSDSRSSLGYTEIEHNSTSPDEEFENIFRPKSRSYASLVRCISSTTSSPAVE